MGRWRALVVLSLAQFLMVLAGTARRGDLTVS